MNYIIVLSFNFIFVIFKNEPQKDADLSRLSWTIIPVLNPDGYVYTQDNNRRWVKNRSGTGLCKGVNVNRNMETAGWGSAGINECADDYQAKFNLIFI